MKRFFYWKIIQVVVAFATVLFPLYMTYDLWKRGGIPEKQVELEQSEWVNPVKDLLGFEKEFKIFIQIGDQTTEGDVLIQKTRIKNIGKSPVLPTDFIEPLSLTLNKPWQIIKLSADDSSVKIKKWALINDSTLVSEPVLINPGDELNLYAYVVKTPILNGFDQGLVKAPNLKWHARIVNMRSFVVPEEKTNKIKYTVVSYLEGWGLIFTLIAALLFQALYLHLLVEGGVLKDWGVVSIFIIVMTSLLSYAVSESISTYLFPSPITEKSGVDNWFNMPIIILHILVLVFLYLKVFGEKKSHSN